MIYDIKNIDCSYVGGSPVLEIAELTIKRNALIFIIGASGVGKSTLLETLGLMNNTIVSDQNSTFNFLPKGESTIDFTKIWTQSNDEKSAIRDKHFSFIFQQTNLMPHFSVVENMVVSQLINGIKYRDARDRIREVMSEIALEESVLFRNISELSGGQRQRLAFVRAFTATFSVLLGDEPTGNLDPATAQSLMRLLKIHLHSNKKTGIIVSHDIHLALKYADIIIPIESIKLDEVSVKGYVHNKLIWNRIEDTSSWMNRKQTSTSGELYELLMDYLQSSQNKKPA